MAPENNSGATGMVEKENRIQLSERNNPQIIAAVWKWNENQAGQDKSSE